MRVHSSRLKTVLERGSLLAVLVVLGACVPGTRDLEQEIARVKAQRGAPVDPLPPMKDYEPYPYTAFNMRDPFSPFAGDDGSEGGDSGQSPDANRVKEALEAFPLDALDMVGTMGSEASMVALVKDPDGVVHRVNVDNYLGQSEGRITAIFEDRIDLVELIPNGTGGWMERPASIALDEG
jgi:type IV pilus assembly protein PilP